MICKECGREISIGYFEEAPVSDGSKYLCPECARAEANILFNNIMNIFEGSDPLIRKAFARYCADDLWDCIKEEEE